MKRSDRGTPDGGHHSTDESSRTISNDSAVPTTATLQSMDLDDGDDQTDDCMIYSPTRSKSTDNRRARIDSTAQPIGNGSAATSVDRFKHGIRYLTDGFIRKVTKQNTISRIQTLNLSQLRDKKVRYIENLQGLTNLEVLDLSNNLIERIDGLKTLKKLKHLTLANNFIRTIHNLEDLGRLETLDLQQNQISEIPVWLSKRLTSLKSLNLANNQISSFDQVARLRTAYELRRVHFHGNPIDQHENYRLLVISYIPSLEQIDGLRITDDERQQAKEQFIQQEVQNLLQELERRDNECRRLNHQATSHVQKLEMTSDKLQSLEAKSSNQAKEIEELQERLAMSEALLQRKTSLLHQACEKQCQLEQELAFYKIDLKFDRFDLSKHVQRNVDETRSPSFQNRDSDDSSSPINTILRWELNEVQRILGNADEGKFFRAEDETIYNEKLLKLAFNISELKFLQAKQETIEERLNTANHNGLSRAVIQHLTDDLNEVQTEMMNKISEAQELKLFLHDLRRDQGEDFAHDLEQVTSELKLDEVVRQHIAQLKQQPQEKVDPVVNNHRQSTSNAVLSSSAGKPIVHDRTSPSSRLQLLESTIAAQTEELRRKELSEQETKTHLVNLQLALEREQSESRQRIEQIEEMAEKEKQRILKHLEEEKRFTRDIIEKSETMIEQLKRELSSERQRKSLEQRNHDALRDIQKKISPRERNDVSKLSKLQSDDENDDDQHDRSNFDGERTVYHKDDPLLASTPRDRMSRREKNFMSESEVLQQQLDERLRDESPERSLFHGKPKSRPTSLPPTPKRRPNAKLSDNLLSNTLEKTPLNKQIRVNSVKDEADEDDQELLYRLHGYVKSGQAFMSKLGELDPMAGNNDSGYSSQQTGRDGQLDNPKLQSLLSTQTFSLHDKMSIDPAQFNREYTVGVVTAGHESRSPYRGSPRIGNVTLYPTPEGYMVGPHSITVSHEARSTYRNISPSQSFTQTDSQYFACVNIPPSGLSSNRPPYSNQDTTNPVRVQGPVIFRQDTVVKPDAVSPISVKIRSLKFPQSEKSTMTDSDGLRREIERTNDEIDYLKSRLQTHQVDCIDENQYRLFRDVLDEQSREIHRIRSLHQGYIDAGRDSEANRLDISREIHRIQRNVHEHLSPKLLRFIDENVQVVGPGRLIPLDQDEHWICTVPRHADLEQFISELQQQIATMKHDNRRLERNLMKKSMKIDALDLAASTKRSKSIAEAENLQDDVYILEQQLIVKQRDLTLAQEQLKQMTSLSHQVIHDLKTARQRHSLAKREAKAYEQKVEAMTKKLYKLTHLTKEAEEKHLETQERLHGMIKEHNQMEKVNDEKRALNLVLDEQLRTSFQAFNSLLNSSMKCLHELTAAAMTEEQYRFHSLPPSPLQLPELSSNLPIEEIQRQISHLIAENNRLLARYHTQLQQERQKSNSLHSEILEKEKQLANVKLNLDSYNEQLKKNAQELLQDKSVLEELEHVKEMKSDKLNELERLIDRRQNQEKQAQHELEQMAVEHQRLKKYSKDLQAENEQLRNSIEADRSILMEMKGESTRLREQIKSFLDEKETLDETVDFLAKKCETLHNECKEKETHLPILISQVDEKLTICKNLEDEIKRLKSDKTRCLEEVTEMKEKIERKRVELARSPNESALEQKNEDLKQRIRRHEYDLDRLNQDIDERNRTLNELNTMITYAKSIMKNIQPTENHRNNLADFPRHDQRHQQENNVYYETKIQRLTKNLDDKEQELRSLNQQLITTKDELMQLQTKVQNQETNADAMRNSMQMELDKLRHWLQIYENRKSMLRPQYHEALKELELKLHEQEMFYRKQIKELDNEMKKKIYGKTPDDSGFLNETMFADPRISPPVDAHETSLLREQIQNIFSHHAQELDKCNSKYKTNLSNLKNRLHELENSTTSHFRADS